MRLMTCTTDNLKHMKSGSFEVGGAGSHSSAPPEEAPAVINAGRR